LAKKEPLKRAARWEGYFPKGGIRDERFLKPDKFVQIRRSIEEIGGNKKTLRPDIQRLYDWNQKA